MRRILFACWVIAAGVACASAGERIMAVQLDLARQIESVPFVKDFSRRVAAAGYDTLVLYLEDRVKTPSYPYASDEESYSLAEMAEIVRAATAAGLDVVPVVSPYGHTERFFFHPEMRHLAEERDGQGRMGPCGNPGVCCLELPESRAWMEKYLSEVASVFPGKNFHFGFDEVFNMGSCKLCRPIMEKEGIGALYMREVMWAHGVAQKLGKRMWMWDDFFAFFPGQLERLPKDVLLCAWNYDHAVELTGYRNNFSRRRRRDNLRDYARLGLDAIYCPWFNPENVRTITAYAQPRPSAGALCTQWEMVTDFMGAFFPRVLATAELWSGRAVAADDGWLLAGVKKAYPSLDEAACRDVVALLEDMGKLMSSAVTVDKCLNEPPQNSKLLYWRNALDRLKAMPTHPGAGAIPPDALSEAALLDDLVTRMEMALLSARAHRAARTVFTPMREPAEVRAAKALVAAGVPRWNELAARRDRQWRAWRPGNPNKFFLNHHASYTNFAARVAAVAEVPSDSEWMLEADLVMPDAYGVPRWKVEGRFGGAWKPLAAGAWKSATDRPAYLPKLVPVTLTDVPDALRISYNGYGPGQLAHVSLWNRNRRLVPAAVTGVRGSVRDGKMILEDTVEPVVFGTDNGEVAMSHPALALEVSSIEVELKEIGR